MSHPGSNEHFEQVQVVGWARANAYREPALDYLYAAVNGAKLPYRRNEWGQRYSKEAERLKAEGLRPGIPDLFLPAARQHYHGLYIEMKFGDNTTSPDQDEVIEYLRRAGYKVEVCYSADEAIQALEDYLGLGT